VSRPSAPDRRPAVPSSGGARGDGRHSTDVVVEARSVTRTFGAFTAVDDVTMHVARGEVVGLLGANGAGKTTLMRMLLGLLPTTSGTVSMLGGPPNRARRRRLGYVPQNLGLYTDMTLAENIEFVAATYGARIPRLTDDLAAYAKVLVGDMPLGAQRQAAFVAALSHAPEAVLLDEPTSGVDALARARLWDTIREQSDRGVGVLVTTHYMQEAQQCDRLLLLSDGVLVAQGSEADVIGDTRALAVRTDDWAGAFTALNAARLPVILDGRAVRVADTSLDDVRSALAAARMTAEVTPVPATIEERMLVLARAGREAS
jgi:ABC-2 type transport system ATP-binding protein